MYRAVRNKGTKALFRLFQPPTQTQPEHCPASAVLSKRGALPALPEPYIVSDSTNCFKLSYQMLAPNFSSV